MGAWLEARNVSLSYRFGVAIYDEREGWRTAAAAEAMAALLKENTVSPDLVGDAVRYSEWGEARVRRALVSGVRPAGRAQRQGKFGEVLHADLLERFCAMIIPVKKHRYNPAPGASPHGIDIIALGRPAKGGGERIVYAETKLRNNAVSPALVEAHKALATAAAEDLPPSLLVVMQMLKKSDSGMYKRVMKASLCGAGAHFRIGVVVERSGWKDGHLDALEQEQAAKELDLGVDIARIGGLDDLVDESFRTAVAN